MRRNAASAISLSGGAEPGCQRDTTNGSPDACVGRSPSVKAALYASLRAMAATRALTPPYG
jgi:hypothetical protein